MLTKFEAFHYLDTEGARAEYLLAAQETGDEAFIADAHVQIERAINYHKQKGMIKEIMEKHADLLAALARPRLYLCVDCHHEWCVSSGMVCDWCGGKGIELGE